MRTVEQIVEQIRAAAGGDFAFVLTRKGRLVTHRAPRDMPEEGRARLLRAARPLVGTDKILEVTLARQDLVPFGGAAPVDVYVGVVAEQAIVCVAMATWAEKRYVAAALEAGMRAIAPLLRRGLPSGRRSSAGVEPAKGSPYVAERTPGAPAEETRAEGRAPHASQPEIAVGEATLGRGTLAAIRNDAAAGGSAPEITVGEASLGRASLVAIGQELGASRGSTPEITMGEAPLGRGSIAAIARDAVGGSLPDIARAEAGGSLPEITVGEAPIGRATLAAIEMEGTPPRMASSPDAIRLELTSVADEASESRRGTRPWVEPQAEPVSESQRRTLPWVEAQAEPVTESQRLTLPWVESPADAKRAADAARFGRKLAPPQVTIRLEDASGDDDTVPSVKRS